eukprot:comp21791_c0_seq1/m.30967 comp21791_c0_seq1/g.30967  ORF comp21791_c0_seq1/g.30967 comp21791_c0_seq1/m.30967 type:complete len:607 (-) comp21791_c0_seq1:178-1998(-)
MDTLNALKDLLVAVFSDTTTHVGTLLLLGVVMVAIFVARYLAAYSAAPKVDVPVPEEVQPGWEGKVLDTLDLKAAGTDKIQCFDPATGESLGSVKAWSREDVAEGVKKAREAQKSWAKTSFEERKRVLRSLMEFVVRNQETICKVAARDSGKTMVDGIFGEILTTCEKISWTLQHGEDVLKPEYRSVGLIMSHKHARVVYEPLGVVAAIVSWNYPFHNVYGPIISALFAGNAIVLKTSEYVAWSTTHYWSQIIKAILRECGHSEDLVQFVVGYADAGSELIKHVDKVTFIGSPGVGKLVMKEASEHLTPVVLELGGKDAAILCDDCDFNQVCNVTMRGFFQNCGQNCIGLERAIVHEKIYDKYVEEMQKRIACLSQGPTLKGSYDCGAMAMGASAAKIEALVQDAVSKGARLLLGGKGGKFFNGQGQYFQPTMLVDVLPNMEIAQEEVFGPVVLVMKFRTEEEALQIVNGCRYGLGSNVFSLDSKRAERLARGIQAGMCNINDFAVSYLCQSLPFGGVKISGFDRFAGPEGLRGNCLVKAITSDRIPGVRTDIPPPLNYPMNASSFSFARSLVDVLYSPSVAARLKAIVTLATVGAQKKDIGKKAA